MYKMAKSEMEKKLAEYLNERWLIVEYSEVVIYKAN